MAHTLTDNQHYAHQQHDYYGNLYAQQHPSSYGMSS